MDRTNPVWREYLKAIIRIQIDAGVAGVELDEADLPIFATGYGGCFCKDCMKLFRAYLQQLPEDELPKELKDEDLGQFHYGSWLPLYWDYIRFQRKTITKYFAELSDYIKEYGRSKGRDALVSGNFYYFTPHYYAFEPKVDVLITEMDSTSYRQPSWSRYAAGFAHGKPVIVVENPYGGVPPELLPKLKAGKATDLFRMMQYEAAALGINMSVPRRAYDENAAPPEPRRPARRPAPVLGPLTMVIEGSTCPGSPASRNPAASPIATSTSRWAARAGMGAAGRARTGQRSSCRAGPGWQPTRCPVTRRRHAGRFQSRAARRGGLRLQRAVRAR